MRLHGLSRSIILNRDTIFMSQFWRNLWNKLGTILKFNSPYHPNIDEKTKVVNIILINILKRLENEHLKNWDKVFAWSQYVCNESHNRTTWMSPFQILYGMHTRGFYELSNSRNQDHRSVVGEYFVVIRQELQEGLNRICWWMEAGIRKEKTWR